MPLLWETLDDKTLAEVAVPAAQEALLRLVETNDAPAEATDAFVLPLQAAGGQQDALERVADMALPMVRAIHLAMWLGGGEAASGDRIPVAPYERVWRAGGAGLEGAIRQHLFGGLAHPSPAQLHAVRRQVTRILEGNRWAKRFDRMRWWVARPANQPDTFGLVAHGNAGQYQFNSMPRRDRERAESSIAKHADQPVTAKFDLSVIPLPTADDGPAGFVTYVTKVKAAYERLNEAYLEKLERVNSLEVELADLRDSIAQDPDANQWLDAIDELRQLMEDNGDGG